MEQQEFIQVLLAQLRQVEGMSALVKEIESRNWEANQLVEFLVEKGLVQVEQVDGDALPIEKLFSEAKSQSNQEEHVLNQLEQHASDVNTPWRAFQVTPLHEAACRGYEQVTRRLLELGADRSALNSMGETASQRCRALGFPAIADLIENY